MIFAYKVLTSDLPKATKEINRNTCAVFTSAVKDIIPLIDGHSMILVDVKGYYPFITDKWKKFIVDDK